LGIMGEHAWNDNRTNLVQITGGTSGFSAWSEDGNTSLTVAIYDLVDKSMPYIASHGPRTYPMGHGDLTLSNVLTTLIWGADERQDWAAAYTHPQSLFNPKTLVLNSQYANSKLDFLNDIDLNYDMRQIDVYASVAEIHGVLSGGGAGIIKGGSGTLVLSANNTYDGDTLVEAGRLDVDGSLASKMVTVSAGATLGGSGSIAGDAKVAGTLLGDGLGVGGKLTMQNGSFFDVNFALDNPALTVGGAMNVLSNVTLNIDGFFDFLGTQDMMTLISGVVNGSFANIFINGQKVDASGMFEFEGSNFYVGKMGNEFVIMDAELIPEPGTWALMVGGLGVLALLRRRKRD